MSRTTTRSQASAAAPLVFFIRATAPNGHDIMPGPFATDCGDQDKAATEARAAFAGTGYHPRQIMFYVAVSPDEPITGNLVPWNEGEGLRLFGIEQEGRP